jgi:hypothetical protein
MTMLAEQWRPGGMRGDMLLQADEAFRVALRLN